MARKGSKENPLTISDLEALNKKFKKEGDDDTDIQDRVINIIAAKIKDGLCHYSYEILEGVGEGATHNVKGPGIIKDSLRKAFERFRVHLAVIDDAFKNSGVEIEDIDQFHGHELTGNYVVDGFKIKGSAENESIILLGNKYVSSAGGRMELASPKIPIDNLSSYKWYNELKELATNARKEVEKYNAGNYTPIEKEEEPIPSAKQTTILDQFDVVVSHSDNEFEGAEI
jgi:hypothetical protein